MPVLPFFSLTNPVQVVDSEVIPEDRPRGRMIGAASFNVAPRYGIRENSSSVVALCLPNLGGVIQILGERRRTRKPSGNSGSSKPRRILPVKLPARFCSASYPSAGHI